MKLGNLSANTECDAFTALLNGGFLRLYDGAAPAGPDTAITTQNKLAELVFGTPAFAVAVAGVATANAITPDSNAAATGTATWYRCFKSDGVTAVVDGSVGTSGSDLNLNSTAIQIHAQVSVSAFAHTVAK